MKTQTWKKILYYAAINACMLSNITAKVTTSANYADIRGLDTDMARETIETQKAWTGMGDDTWHGVFSITPQFQKNIRGQNPGLGTHVFWSGKSQMSAGLNTGITKHNLDVFQLGLGSASGETTIHLDPEVKQMGANLFFYAGSSEIDTGLWIKTHAPVGSIKINPHLTQTNNTLQAGTYGADILDGAAVDAPYQNIEEAFAGGKSAGTLQPMRYGKISGEQSSGAKFGDLQLSIGYNVLANTDYHLGLGARVSAPTGNKPEGEYALEPIFGKGGQWCLGAELIGHWTFWRHHHNKLLQLWFDGHISHAFAAKQKRSFDLKTNPGSKYMLVGDFNNGTNQQIVQNFINVATLDVDISNAALIDLAAHLRYEDHNWSAGLGYNFYGKTKEKLKQIGKLSESRYALVGQETVHNGAVKPDAKMDGFDNAAVGAAQGTDAANRISGNDALDFESATHDAGWTSKVFANIDYNFKDLDHAPYIGLLGSGEFSHSDNNATSQWSIGIYGGMCF